MRKSLLILVLVVLLLSGFTTLTFVFQKNLKELARNVHSYKRLVEAVCMQPDKKYTVLPRNLNNVPFGEQMGVVSTSKTLAIRGDVVPYNASILKKEKGEGYHLFFRYDVLTDACSAGFFSQIGYAELDQNFDQTEKEFVPIDVQSTTAEDPRVIQSRGQAFLVYNDFEQPLKRNRRIMYMRPINLSNLKVGPANKLDPCLSSIEKNWAPFEYIDQEGKPKLHFEYTILPRKILRLENLDKNMLTHLPPIETANTAYWPNMWGGVRGGTPAQKIGDCYLAFFHSYFKDENGIIWYCMGAYTFESKPPFRLTGISNYPILFDGIYNSPPLNLSDPSKRVIFPCGFTIDGDLIHVSCGENDASTKIVTFHKNELLAGLKKIKVKPIPSNKEVG